MKNQIIKNFLFMAICVFALTACKKTSTELDLPTAVSQNGAIPIVSIKSILGDASSSTDSIYAVGAVITGNKLTVATAASLPTAINTYLTTNYPNYTFVNAFTSSLTTSTTVNGYIVAVNFNTKPVVLRFTSIGGFIGVLELREGNDLKNNRDHSIGGIYENRNSTRRDSLGIAELSTTIKTYMTTNASRDTLKAVWKNRDGSIVLLSKNATFFVNTFTSAGVFIAKTSLSPTRAGAEFPILPGALPAAIQNYFTLSYPKYIIGKAYYTAINNVVNGHIVIIDANLTKYAFVFTSTGTLQTTSVLR